MGGRGGASIVPATRIENLILEVRHHRVMLDQHLAELYGVETRMLLQAVKRNRERFPADFRFRLTRSEWAHLRSQSVISSSWGGRRYPPYGFTEEGMLSSVLRSRRAIRANVAIMRAFVRFSSPKWSLHGGSTPSRRGTTLDSAMSSKRSEP